MRLGAIIWLLAMAPADGKLNCRISSAVADSADIAAHVQSEFGTGSSVADWNDIKTDYAGNLAAFYAETGLANGQSAMLTVGGQRWTMSHQYYVIRWDSGNPPGLELDSFGSLYLQRWSPVTLPVVASIRYRLSAEVASTADIPSWLTQQYGVGAVMVDWNEVKTHFSTDITPFYRQTGLPDGGQALITRDGQRIDWGTRHFYTYRNDGGPPGGLTYDNIGSLYLQSWELTKPVIYQLVPPSAPTGVVASDSTSTAHVEVAWSASGVLSYEVWRATVNNSASATRIATGVLANSHYDTTALGGVEYFYWVKAVGVGGTSGFSAADPGKRLFSIALGHPSTWTESPACAFQIQITCNGQWTASDDQDWITVDPAVGTGNGSVTVNLIANQPSMITRAGTVNIGGVAHAVIQEGLVVPASSAFRLTAPTLETGDLAAVVTASYGSTASMADWLEIEGHCAGDCAVLYASAGLPNNGLAWVMLNDAGWSGSNHYFVQRFDSGKPGDFNAMDRMGSLYLGTWHGLNAPVLAKMRYRMTPAVSDADDSDATTATVYGTGAVIAEWNDIKAAYAASPVPFYAHTGLRDQHAAWVKCGGTVWNGSSRYFVQRFDRGKPEWFGEMDHIGSLYLGSWFGMVMPVMSDVGGTGNGTGGFEDWIRNFPEIAIAERGIGNDPDGDGSGNLAEYAAATSAAMADSGASLYQAATGPDGVIRARFRVNPEAVLLTSSIEWSPDLVSWAGSGSRIGGVIMTFTEQTVSTAPDHRVVEVTATPGTVRPARVFLRRVVTPGT